MKLIILLVSLLLSPTLVYAQVIDNTYSDSSCSTPSSNFNLGDMVYASASGLSSAQDHRFDYKYPNATVACSNEYVKGPTSICDNIGCQATVTGTWTVELIRVAGNKLQDNKTYTVSVSEFPSYTSAMLVFLFLALFYLFLKKKV
jgi:hypothetical protein